MYRRIAIVGSGSIGIYYGARLALAGAEVRFLMRRDLAPVRARGSLKIVTGSSEEELKPVLAFATTAEIGPVDLVIVTLKATANTELPQFLPPLLGPETVVLTLQNGLGSEETIAAIVGANRVLGGLAYIATNRTAPGEVACFHPGSVTLGEFGRAPEGRTQALADQFIAAGVKTRIAPNLDAARWHKLVWNVPFNGLSIAAGGIATDRICADPKLADEAKALMAEIQQGASKLGHAINDDFVKQQFDVTAPMGAYRPSSLVDFQSGRDAEVEAIWGEPLRRARSAGAEMPRLGLLYALLKKMVSGRNDGPKPAAGG